jgi:hypothetical protein
MNIIMATIIQHAQSFIRKPVLLTEKSCVAKIMNVPLKKCTFVSAILYCSSGAVSGERIGGGSSSEQRQHKMFGEKPASLSQTMSDSIKDTHPTCGTRGLPPLADAHSSVKAAAGARRSVIALWPSECARRRGGGPAAARTHEYHIHCLGARSPCLRAENCEIG